jgi:hypothetical protein
MLPLLRKVATHYEDFPQLRAMDAYNSINASGAALQHWYEVAPDEARPAIIKEILRPRPRFNAKVLGILPDKSLPEVEQPLAEHLTSQTDFEVRANIATLIERYATANIEPAITAFLDGKIGNFECSVQSPLLAYMLKVDPESARSSVEAAVSAKGEGFSGCSHFLLPELGKLQDNPMLQDIAIKGLEDSDPQIVSSSAAYLKEHGSASAEDALWARFTAWSERWAGRESELQFPGRSQENMYASGEGTSLLEALASGHAWLADESKLRRLMALSIGPQQRQHVQQFLDSWAQRTMQFIPVGGDGAQYLIAQYNEHSLEAAKEKLQQFPAGTTFQWLGGAEESESRTFDELSRFASEHHLKILPAKDAGAN